MATAWMVRCFQASTKNTHSTIRFTPPGYCRYLHQSSYRLSSLKIQTRQIKTLKGADKQVQSVAGSQALPTEDSHVLNNNSNNNEFINTKHTRPNFLPLDTSFSNAEEAYKSKSTSELLRAMLVFKLTSVGWIVKQNAKVSGLFVCLLSRCCRY